MSRKIRSLKKWPKGCSGAKGDDIVDGCKLADEVWGDAADDPDTGPLAFAYLYRRFGPPPFTGDTYKDLACWLLTTPDPDVFLWLTPAGGAVRYAVGYIARKSVGEEARKADREWADRCLMWIAERVAEERPDLVSRGTGTDGLDELAEEGWRIAHERAWDIDIDGWWMRAAAAVGERPKSDPGSSAVHRRVNDALVRAMKSLMRPAYVRDIGLTIVGEVGRVPRPSGWAKPRAKGAA